MDWGSLIGSIAGSYLNSSGSGGGGSSNGYADIFKAILGGIGGSSDAKLTVALAKEKAETEGKQDRKTLDFTSQLNDYYGQLGKQRKRTALDTYGQFSLMDRYKPNYTPAAPVQMPARPSLDS